MILGPKRRFSGILARKEYFVGTQVDESSYHVLLEGFSVGPYNRRTITGMRVKHALSGNHVLIGKDGARLTVRELISPGASGKFWPSRKGPSSRARATYPAALIETEGYGLEIPPFKGELEARVHDDVLRLAGRFRRGFAWREDRIKIPLGAVVHAQLQGSRVDLWVRSNEPPALHRIALDLFTYEAAAELVDWLPEALACPESAAPVMPKRARPAVLATAQARKVATLGLSVALGLMVMALIYRGVS